MKTLKSNFSIKDFENISGIKAHTIRIWEKRYGIFSPDRLESNYRTYGDDDLKKLLNINLLYNNGYKISKIAKLSNEDFRLEVKKNIDEMDFKSKGLESFKLSMFTFDHYLFNQTYYELMEVSSFVDVFHNVFLPLLEIVGLLWQQGTAKIVHEHFISNLIRQKVCLNIDNLKAVKEAKGTSIYALFLPTNEIHELGLLYINYELLLREEKTIYLGQSVPAEDLGALTDVYENVHYISYFTINIEDMDYEDYLMKLGRALDPGNKLSIVSPYIELKHITEEKFSNVNVFKSYSELLTTI
jgi:DNA-binding transcriptional MerR regulator